MSKAAGTTWKRIGIEAATIVGSILLAFAIEAWWAERLERADEDLQLDRLRAEFSTNISRIDVREFEEEILDATKQIYDLIQDGRNRGVDAIEVPAVLVGMMLVAPTFDADTPILTGLVRSGRLRVIENEKVLSLISEWERTIYDYTTFAERARRTVDERLIPALAVRSDIGPILMTPAGTFNQIRADGLPDVQIQIDDELKGLVAERWRNGRSALRRFATARGVAGEIVAEIDSGDG